MIEAFDPTAIPLWMTFLFAASMYPLGFLLPGCACCGSAPANCHCGVVTIGYVSGQNPSGRMCCSSVRPSEITLRVTSTGPANAVYKIGTSSSYTKRTVTNGCQLLDGDYVLSAIGAVNETEDLTGSLLCGWELGYSGGGSESWQNVQPIDAGGWPNWKYQLIAFRLRQPFTVRTQTCTYDADLGSESCTVGTTRSDATVYGGLWTAGTSFTDYPIAYGTTSYSSQRCNPAGAIVSPSLTINATVYAGGIGFTDGPLDLNCTVKAEFV